MLKRNRKNNQSVVGLDLDPSHIAAAEVKVNGHIAIKRGAVAELRPGILRDGEVTDAPALAEALRAFFAENELPKRVRLGVANQRIVVRSIDLPPLEDQKALDAAVKRRGARPHPDADGRGDPRLRPARAGPDRPAARACAWSSSPPARSSSTA